LTSWDLRKKNPRGHAKIAGLFGRMKFEGNLWKNGIIAVSC
jgi:hypothetical protein